MATRRQAAAAARKAAAAAPSPPPLDGHTVALCGNFTSYSHNQSSMEDTVRRLGGKVAKSITRTTTLLICSEVEYIDRSNKVRDAMAKKMPILGPGWLLDTEREKRVVDTAPYDWDIIKPTSTNNSTVNSANGGDKKNKRPAPPTPAGDGGPDVKKTKIVAEGQFMKNDGVIQPDEHWPLVGYQVYVEPDTCLIWDASLNQANSGRNNNKFYRIQQILHNPDTGDYKTWTRWGRVGDTGQSAILEEGGLDVAVTEFKRKFKDKSGLAWEHRGDDPKPNKYAFVEKNYNDSDDEDDDDDAKPKKKTAKPEGGYGGAGAAGEEEGGELASPKSALPKPVQELMELIFNQKYFQATMDYLNYDANKLPLGKLSKSTITRGFQQLKDLAALLNDPSLAASRWQTTLGPARERLSNTYYSLIPHDFGRHRPPTIMDGVLLKKEIDLLESLSDMKAAADIMKVNKKTQETVNKLDAQFQGLGLEEMCPLDRKSDEFSLLAGYLNGSRGSTHHVSYKIQDIFRVERQGERDRFDASEFARMVSAPAGQTGSDRRLLWHGSRCTNFAGILSQGLRIAPPEAPVSGYMFGKGIYLADMSSKSAGYCSSSISDGHALLLLCEAELGDPMHELIHSSYSAGEDAKKLGKVSTWGMGRTGPSKWTDACIVNDGLKGIKMPDPDTPPSTICENDRVLYYNEYICYDVAQVKIRYLFRVKM
ncbi:hypothetical protein GMORB2_2717 [Geosmithia morbida]|uniref:Poly [ADP-ribose] polymerase n=1 Tax=Geosmithia morbida TaxID=1094350 RepID=A0A9P4YPF7_9HYPO|nr:uncharacterized protein GMORB2_2717 [Geosmithia morbida]KAF4120713.1 hypothetical protein GMORB2_2717 [Geosmithia morbida]